MEFQLEEPEFKTILAGKVVLVHDATKDLNYYWKGSDIRPRWLDSIRRNLFFQ